MSILIAELLRGPEFKIWDTEAALAHILDGQRTRLSSATEADLINVGWDIWGSTWMMPGQWIKVD